MTGLTLMLNAAEQRLQFGLARDGELLCGQDWIAASQGVELLTAAFSDALARLRLSPAAVGRIACVIGPGGFTGLRLILATASALHHSLRIPLASINYLELLAASIPAAPGQCVRVLTRARRDLVYAQDFRYMPATGPEPLNSPHVRELHAALESLPDSSPFPTLLIGSGVSRHPELHLHTPYARAVPGQGDQPSWDAFVRLAGRAVYMNVELEPMYLRASEAEDNLEMLAERRGDDPSQARVLLQHLLRQPPTDIA